MNVDANLDTPGKKQSDAGANCNNSHANKAAVGDIVDANKDCSGTSDSALPEPAHDVDTSYQTIPISADAAPPPEADISDRVPWEQGDKATAVDNVPIW